MAKKTDQKTLELIKEVNRRKEEISKLERPLWKTNCSFSYIENEHSSSYIPINIHVESNLKNLVNIAAFLMDKERSYNTAATVLEVESTVFTWCGFTVSDWIEDLKTRINKIQIATKKKTLEVLETRLNAVISPELRAEMELQAIADALT